MRIRVIWQGRTKDPHLRALETEFSSRLRHFTDIVVEETDSPRRTEPINENRLSTSEKRLIEKLRGSTKIFLDGRGREWTSEEFAEWLGQQALRGVRELAFVVGGPEGFSAAFRKHADHLMALSRMTLTRDWARALLLEQIYRGFTILRGYPYSR
jgi:23S rRNA (pseudouridine1915-N3)-methyltransferase